MTNINQKNATPETRIEVEELNMKPQEATSLVGSVEMPYQIDVTPVLREQPNSPFAIALSIAVVLGAIATLLKTIKSQ
ncbi:hypothetical protein VB620_09385 [Nodularia harveyana UHCC-0300]|uniref:Uncharacterized protein n=1 Tax=Nodularia harveyana UHCC-0300 TaxID=2974287 RepID=A0ABU5UDE3_9CYAN|nr:hypothetical protein [Nodularia harveyana]MEA5581552.1 hypothetical protein [Nodularia harveyana UHCC-0300]